MYIDQYLLCIITDVVCCDLCRCIIRRTAALLTQYLPVKTEQVTGVEHTHTHTHTHSHTHYNFVNQTGAPHKESLLNKKNTDV